MIWLTIDVTITAYPVLNAPSSGLNIIIFRWQRMFHYL